MKSSKDILGSIIKTTQMGQSGIKCVQDRTTNRELKNAMESQLREYDQIEAEAQSIASKHNWELPSLNPAVSALRANISKMRLAFGSSDSRIAAMMIRGNTAGIIKGQRNLNHTTGCDEDIETLSKKLLITESNNIQQMKPYL